MKTIAVGNGPQSLATAGGRVWLSARAAAADHRGGTLRIAMPADSSTGSTRPSRLPASVVAPCGNGRRVGRGQARQRSGRGHARPRSRDAAAGPDRRRAHVHVPAPAGDQVLERRARSRERPPARPQTRLPPRLGGAYFYGGLVGGDACSEKRCDLSRGVVADDRAGTVTLHLRAPDPELLYKLALPLARPVPRGCR